MSDSKGIVVLLALAVATLLVLAVWQAAGLRTELADLADREARTAKRLDDLTAKVTRAGGFVRARSTPALEKMRDSVVPVRVEGYNNGSGVVYESQGRETYVLTAEHVVRPVRQQQAPVAVSVGGEWLSATLIDWDAQADLAVLKINGAAPVAEISTRTVDVGDRVIAIGGPPGLEGSVSTGDVSGLDRHVDIAENPAKIGYDGLIQSTVSVTAGSSGGGLFSPEGQLVGIICLNSDDYAYAVPIRRAYDKLIK